ncbi:glycosyl hydrolase family 28 protein [Niveispirillum sp. KHB5.9]|uniref:glycosyl hydrolase family 28 protein n=1 Tax=Niveispirillum sp. KHB5.9 TaxID=3400269 RepID=UPI003A8A341D
MPMNAGRRALCAAFMTGLLSWASPAQAAENRLRVHPSPKELQYTHHNDDFTVQVRTPDGAWQDLYEWNVRVDLDRPQDASMVYFDFTGTVELRAQKNNGRFQTVTVGPETDAPVPSVQDGKVHLMLDRPRNLALFFDDDRLHNLHIFAGDPVAAPEGSNVRRFGPGLHRLPEGEDAFRLRSGETAYLEGGAVLMGSFRVEDASDVRILGHGLILAPPGKNGAQFQVLRSRDVTVDGPIITQADSGVGRIAMSRDVRVSDVKGISGGKWTDGINVYSSEKVALDRLFLRTSDDCLTIYTSRNEIVGDARDITIRNSTLWSDIAHAMFIGIHGNTPKPEVIERVRFENIDVISIDEDDPEYEGVMAITAGDSNLVRDVEFNNIRVDRIEEGKLFNFHVGYNTKYNTSPGRGIENIRLRDIRYSGVGLPSASLIAGYDEKRGVRGVSIENLVIGGRRITGLADANLEIGSFTQGITIR